MSDTEIDLLETVKIYKNSKIVHCHSLDMDDHILSLTEVKTQFHVHTAVHFMPFLTQVHAALHPVLQPHVMFLEISTGHTVEYP